jgi:alpha-amylase
MTEFNGAMMQYFHWYIPADGRLWNQLEAKVEKLAQSGITALWLPPAYKGAGGKDDVGYGVYDLFDLGEFDQKGSVATKYGTQEEYLRAIQAAREAGVQVYADVVFNHKMGADHQEEFHATPYNPKDRNEPVGEKQKIKAWTHFTFPGRKKKYSGLEWHWWHFTAADHNVFDEETDAIYLFEGKQFEQQVDSKWGNYDYLMGCDLDIQNPDVQKELYHWGAWYLETTRVDGFRFDAVKHVQSDFFLKWLHHIQAQHQQNLFAVGEYWSGRLEPLKQFIETTEGSIMLFDSIMHYRFAEASKQGKHYDLRKIFDGTLVQAYPDLAVTLVSNHDTQPLQALQSVVEAWFKPLAYALILLRKDGYPCIFYADYYGAEYKGTGQDGKEYEITMASHQWIIDRFLQARKSYAWGEQLDYLDHPRCIGWTRTGNQDNQGGMAVILSNGEKGHKKMKVGSPHTQYKDLTDHIKETVKTDANGDGVFRCESGSVSVWIPA